MLKLHQRYYLYLAVLWCCVIIVLCSVPGSTIPKVTLFEHVDKLVHALMFFVFVFLWTKALGQQKLFQIIIVAIVFGIAIEFYQKYCIVGRSMDPWDAVADSVGAIVWLVPWLKKEVHAIK
jgi:VanZ family protein